LPECKAIREIQYRVMVKSSDTSAMAEQLKVGGNTSKSKTPKTEKGGDGLQEVGKPPRIEPIFEYLSPRIPYEIANLSHLTVTREMVIGLKMKDIFSNRRLFMSTTAKEIYHDLDQRIFFDFFGIDKLNTKMLIGQSELSLIDTI